MADLKNRVKDYFTVPSEALPFGDGNDNPYAKHGLRNLIKSIKGLYMALAALTTFIFLLLFLYLLRPTSYPSPTIAQLHDLHVNCGASSTEAEHNGCTFDILSGAWIHQSCLEATTLAEYRTWIHSPDRRNGSFPFFTDRMGLNRIESEYALAHYTGDVYTTWEEHLAHCVFLSKRMARAYDQGLKLDTRIRDPGHTIECADVLIQGVEKGVWEGFGHIGSKFTVSYEKC